MSVVTLVSTVGSKRAPPALRLPSTATLAPIFTASAMRLELLDHVYVYRAHT
jgi:hypothetical protein